MLPSAATPSAPRPSERLTSQEELLQAISAGQPILVPTDTVYGIAADPTNPEAVGAVFAMKGRPDSKPLPVLGQDAGSLAAVAEFDDRAAALAAEFWPGPLTLVLRRATGFDHDLGGSEADTVAVRVPSSEPLRKLLERSGPLAVTSANRSGEQPASTLDEASAVFGEDVPFLEGGDAAGEPSTVLSLTGAPEMLRAGAIELAAIEDCLKDSGLGR